MTIEEIDALAQGLSRGQDREFFTRIWTTPATVYEHRLRALKFTGLTQVLDLGSGMGQWLRALAGLNESVTGLEYATERVVVSAEILTQMQIGNARVVQGAAEAIPFADQSFDAIFSYSVLLLTDYRKALAEAWRVLKPGGKFYFNTNGLGWYLYNLIDGHNSSANYSSRDMAVGAFANSLTYFTTGVTEPGGYVIMPQTLVLAELEALGFKILAVDGEGRINLTTDIEITPFFPGEKYGHEAVYEVLCEK